MIENVSVNYSEPMPFPFIFLLPSSEDMITTLHSLQNRNFNFMLFKAMQSEQKLPGSNLKRRKVQARKEPKPDTKWKLPATTGLQFSVWWIRFFKDIHYIMLQRYSTITNQNGSPLFETLKLLECFNSFKNPGSYLPGSKSQGQNPASPNLNKHN